MTDDFGDRIVAVTGAARGIGAAIAQAFLKSGAHVVALDRDAASLKRAGEKFAVGTKIDTIVTDVGNESSVRDAFAAIDRTHGGLDVLVNNAGIAIRRQTIDLTLEEWEAVLRVNITGAFLCAKHAGPLLFKKLGSSVVNIASIMGMSGGGLYPNPSYQASKGAVVNFTRALAVEWAPRGVRVNAVAPTWVKTELRRADHLANFAEKFEGLADPLSRTRRTQLTPALLPSNLNFPLAACESMAFNGCQYVITAAFKVSSRPSLVSRLMGPTS